jgi:hypothetical protein
MERVLHANEETALNPDPFDPVEPEFVAGAVVGLGTMRQGSDAAPAVPVRAASSCNGPSGPTAATPMSYLRTASMGHFDPFPPPRLNGRYPLS